MVEVYLVVKFNKDGYFIIDYNMYVLVGDGDLMEGVVYEVMLMVGYMKFGKLIVLYDLNEILFDGELGIVFFEDI